MIKKVLTSIIMLFIIVGAALNVAASSAPKISGPDLIQKQRNQVLTISDILALYTSNVGGVSIQEDNFTGNGARLGIYEIELIASNGQEQVLKTIEIEVIQFIGYSVRAVTDKKNIHISKDNKLIPVEIIQIHSRTGLFNVNSSTQFEILTDEYSTQFDTPGTYLFEYRIMDATGLDKSVSAQIAVHESDRLQGPVFTVPQSPGVFDQLLKVLNTIITVVIVAVIGFFGFKLYKIGRKK